MRRTVCANGSVDREGAHILPVIVCSIASFASMLLFPALQSVAATSPDRWFANPQARVRNYPQSVASGDLNGDGRVDLVTANRLDGSLSVLLRKSSSQSFARARTLATAISPWEVELIDLNGDGHLDIVASHLLDGFSGSITVRLGVGDGTFLSSKTRPMLNRAFGFTIADFNGDRKPDIAVTIHGYQSSTDYLAILIGRGDGMFRAPQNIVVAESKSPLLFTASVASGDFDRDGRIDLAVSTGLDARVLWGNGDGTFSAPFVLTGSVAAAHIETADLNGDGRSDLIVARSAEDKVSIYKAGAARSFGVRDYALAGPVVSVVFDQDGDGLKDLAVATATDVALLRGRDGGTFRVPTHYFAGAPPLYPVAGDFSDDGRSDIAVANADTNSVSILRTSPTGRLVSAPRGYRVASLPTHLAAGDLNGDGNADLAVALDNTPAVDLLKGLGDGKFQTSETIFPDGFPFGEIRVAAADFTDDGRNDLVITGGNGIFRMTAETNGVLRPATNIGYSADYIWDVDHGDVNGDGKRDVLVAGRDTDTIQIWFGTSNGAYEDVVDVRMGDGPTKVLAADINGDGRDDVVSLDWFENRVSYRLRTSSGFSARKVLSFSANLDHLESVAAGDLNNDGRLDLVTGVGLGPLGHVISVRLNNGDNTFGQAKRFAAAGGGGASNVLELSDVDGDGFLDAVVSSISCACISVLPGRGDGTFGPYQSFLAAHVPIDIVVADFNADGKPDVAVADSDSGGSIGAVAIHLQR